MQQLLRPLDHVSDSGGTAGRAQSADVTNDSKPGGEDDYGNDQLGRIGGFSLHGGGLPRLDFMTKLAALVPRPRTNLSGPRRRGRLRTISWSAGTGRLGAPAFRQIAGTVSA